MFEITLILLLILVLVAALIAVETRDLLSAVIVLGALGFGMAVIFLLLKAPEVMTAQLVVEILTFVMMVMTVYKSSRFDHTTQYTFRSMTPQVVAVIFFGAIFLIISLPVLKALPQFGSPLMKVSSVYIEKVLSEIGAANIVTAVLLDFRGYNTLIEAIVILTMAVGVSVIMRKEGRKKGGGK
jgi:multisubunit Na+/H+ antiporter MnhB subunit